MLDQHFRLGGQRARVRQPLRLEGGVDLDHIKVFVHAGGFMVDKELEESGLLGGCPWVRELERRRACSGWLRGRLLRGTHAGRGGCGGGAGGCADAFARWRHWGVVVGCEESDHFHSIRTCQDLCMPGL